MSRISRRTIIISLPLLVILAFSTGLALGGVNGDANLDAVFANFGQPNRVCLGNGDGTFGTPGNECTDVSGDTFSSNGVALGFVNGDTNLDAVFANDGESNRICLGNGNGTFGTPGNECSDVSGDTNDSLGVALGFVNSDTNLDAVFANDGESNRVCLGNGNGTFGTPGNECSDVSGDTFSSNGVALGFVDGDTNLDAVFANVGESNRVCLGNGVGGFTCTDVSGNTFSSNGVALGDVNSDSTLDAVFANDGLRNRVCLGDGLGEFSCSDVGSDIFDSDGVALGFVTGDSTLDAVFANVGESNRVCLGDGLGGFCRDVSSESFSTNGVALGFVDGDADLDAVFANGPTLEANRVCLGNGDGTFGTPGNECTNVSPDTNQSRGVALAVEANLALTKSSPERVGVNVPMTYSIITTNNGPFAATGVVVTDPLPAGATFLSISSVSQGTCRGTSTIICVLGTISNDDSASVEITVRPTMKGTLTNTASVTSSVPDPDETNNSATATTAVHPECFIATAAFGSPLAPQVQLLRDFRDQYLLPHAPGRMLVSLYYALSPSVAEVIAESETLRAIVRAGLIPIIGWAALVLWAPSLGIGIPLVALALGAWLALRRVRRRRRATTGLAVLLSPDRGVD